jgi:hypothetical protein
MNPMKTLLWATTIALSGAAFAGNTSGTLSGANAIAPDGVVMVQRNVYIPVNEKGSAAADEMIVVERQAYIPADHLQQDKRSQAGMSSSNATTSSPAAVFVLVPDAANGATAASGSERQYRMRRLDQVASNDPRCSDLTGQLPEDCYAKGGTGAAATASTQGQSGR